MLMLQVLQALDDNITSLRSPNGHRNQARLQHKS